jgi:hypothetical protein
MCIGDVGRYERHRLARDGDRAFLVHERSWIQGILAAGNKIIPVSLWTGAFWFSIRSIGRNAPRGIMPGSALEGQAFVRRWGVCAVLVLLLLLFNIGGQGLGTGIVNPLGELIYHGRPWLVFPNSAGGLYIGELDSHLNADSDAGVPAQAGKDEVMIHLFNGENLDNFYTFLKDRGRDSDPKNVFTVQDGLLRISGEEWGCITTVDEFENYHLITEFKWGETTWEPRKDRARDSGILIHSQGEDGGYGGIWMNSIECQIIEGGTGDIIVVGDGTDAFSVTCHVATETQNGSHVYRPAGELATRNSGRINWWGRDLAWEDVLGFRGRYEVENPVGEWNRLECIVQGGRMRILLNGVVVNEAVDMTPKRGRIQVQSEAAELFFRRIDLIPLLPESAQLSRPDRAHRFIYNSDANNMFLYQDVPMTPEDLYPYVDELANTQITTLFMSPNNGMVMNYPSKTSGMLGEGRYDELPPPGETEPKSQERTALLFRSLVDAGHDPLGLVLSRARDHGLEVFISFRMNEVHATEDPDSMILSRFWKEHPE